MNEFQEIHVHVSDYAEWYMKDPLEDSHTTY